MELNQLKFTVGSRKPCYRVGRGVGSGNGKTCGKGHKGQNSRTGGGVRPGFEGGQNPIYRRLPKRGFHNFTRVEYEVVNVEALEVFKAGTIVTPALLAEARLIRSNYSLVKILGNGELTKKLTVSANKFSASADAAIKAAGGTVEVI